MRIYRNGSPFRFFFQTAGSALPYAAIPGLLSALLTLVLEVVVPEAYVASLLSHPYPFQPFAYIAAFVLVFRTNVAYNRYWEAMTTVTQMGSKWADALAEAVTFDELPRGKPEDHARNLELRRRFQALIIRRFSLMHGLALQYLRRDDALGNLTPATGSYVPNVPMGLGAFGGMEGPKRRDDARWQQLDVLGGVTASERRALESSHDRVGFVSSNILHLCNQRRADGGLGVDAPVLSRYYQLVSDGSLGFRQARKVEDIPFPWPYTQVVSAFVGAFTFVFPVVLVRFANGEPGTLWIGPMIAFLTVTTYTALHNVAKMLEDPFVHPPNDLPANALQAAFNLRLLTTWDAVRSPADEEMAEQAATEGEGDGDAAVLMTPPASPSAKAAPFVARGRSETEDDHWGLYASLEQPDSREAARRLLAEWRAAPSHQRTRGWSRYDIGTPRLVRQARPESRSTKNLHRSKTSPSIKTAELMVIASHSPTEQQVGDLSEDRVRPTEAI